MGRVRSLPLKDVRAKCRQLREHLLASGAVGVERLDAIKPGGAQNPETGALGEMQYLCLINQMFAVDQAAYQPKGEATDHADAVVLAALAGRPERVILSEKVGDRDSVKVYPKSAEALIQIASQDAWLAELAAKRATLLQLFTDEDRALLDRVDRELTYCLQVLAWVVTSKDPRLPFEDSMGDVVTMPDWVRELNPLDLTRIVKAHQNVNGHRLQALNALISPGPPAAGPRPKWSVLIGALAHEKGVQAEVLMQDWSLGALLASVRLSGEAKHQASEASKRRQSPQTVTPGAF